jgi:hypothetical protein
MNSWIQKIDPFITSYIQSVKIIIWVYAFYQSITSCIHYSVKHIILSWTITLPVFM